MKYVNLTEVYRPVAILSQFTTGKITKRLNENVCSLDKHNAFKKGRKKALR